MGRNSNAGSLGVIAARCGVSRRVVAAVLSPHGGGTVGFSEATRAKVEAAAREAGYQGNRTARWLARGRHGSVGVVASTSYLIPDALMNGMLIAARQRGWFLVFDRALEGEPPMFFDERCIDGLVSFDDLRETDRRRIARMGLPTLWVNTNRRNGTNVVTYDERGATRLAVEHLRERGWTRPMALDLAGLTHYSAGERLAGVRDAAPDAAAFLSSVAPSGEDAVIGRRAGELERHLRENPDIDAAVSFHSGLIPSLYEALRRIDRRPGEDFGVVTFGRYGPARSVFPLVTALAIDEHSLGMQIVKLLEDLVEGRKTGSLPLTVGYELIVRGSTEAKQKQDG
jgi:LacI family transcriptional regulator